jgi:hypothetical protein
MWFIPLITVGLAALSDRRQSTPEHFGLSTGIAGIRGAHFKPFTQAQIDAYNREGAAQGLRGTSAAPAGVGPYTWG